MNTGALMRPFLIFYTKLFDFRQSDFNLQPLAKQGRVLEFSYMGVCHNPLFHTYTIVTKE
ncbi:hypothetical protein SAMN04488072_101427 [Lentibacillus halodurans]|uniref:Uncharacterized protein n=1 Tax=Lentibacillus halodurans TaxID=237679 RepID=A0A1I0VII5_9BACI|nr:hypothetical protein SAMN04488072_101427 [Lentibacillus halodurans]